jgi:putative DNA primase/helicase
MSAPTPLLKPRLGNVPADLAELIQWVVWRAEWIANKGKYNKVPVNARTGEAASSTDPTTWSSFTEACHAYEQGGDLYGGIGFVVSEDEPYVGVDFDHCIENGVLADWTARYLNLLDSYAEVSPSGTGLRIFLRGTLPPDGRKKGDVEVYETGRFLTITGRKWPTAPATINYRQAELESLHREVWPPKPPQVKRRTENTGTSQGISERALLDRAFVARNGAQVQTVYNGDNSAHNNDPSAADLALCCYLAFWTGPDANRLDSLFRSSPRMRDKWDERRYADGRTYGEATVQKAIENCTEFYDWNRRAERQEQTLREAEAISGEAAGEVSTPESIPAPYLTGEYAPYQIAELLGFDTGVAADTHKAHAERIRQYIGEDIVFCPQLGGWRFWNGKAWPGDGQGAPTLTSWVARLSPNIREEAARLYALAGTLARTGRTEDSEAMAKAAKSHLKHAQKVENTSFIRDSLAQAAGLLRTEAHRFEPRPWVIGFENGVWDRGEWREHRREDYFLSVCPVEYDLAADRSEWYALLQRLTDKDADLARSLQQVCGYVLSGASSLRTIPWAYGPRGSGKSTVEELLLTVLGDMGKTIDPTQLADNASRERLGAAIFGARLVAVSEAGNQRIGAEVVKTLSGSDSYPVRHLYSEAFTARPSHVLLMVANDPPRMDAYDEALKERVMTLPFSKSLADPEPLIFRDGKRIEEVRRNPNSLLLRGFVAWVVEGLAQVWETQSIYRAACIERASRQFWQDTDPLADFWDTVRTDELRDGIAKGGLRKRYENWCEDEGIRRPLSPRDWTRACRSRGLVDTRLADEKGSKAWRLSESSDRSDQTDLNFNKSLREEKVSAKGFYENSVSLVRTVRNGTEGTDTSGVSTVREEYPPLSPEDYDGLGGDPFADDGEEGGAI